MSKPNSYIYTGMAYEVLSFVADIVVFCFEECWIDCLSTIQLKLRKSQSEVFITFDKPLIWSQFFCLYGPLGKAQIKNKHGRNFGRYWRYRFSDTESNWIIYRRVNPSGELVISEEESAAIDTSAVKETNI